MALFYFNKRKRVDPPDRQIRGLWLSISFRFIYAKVSRSDHKAQPFPYSSPDLDEDAGVAGYVLLSVGSPSNQTLGLTFHLFFFWGGSSSFYKTWLKWAISCLSLLFYSYSVQWCQEKVTRTTPTPLQQPSLSLWATHSHKALLSSNSSFPWAVDEVLAAAMLGLERSVCSSACFSHSSRRPYFSFQHSRQVTDNCLELQLQGICCHLLKVPVCHPTPKIHVIKY